MVGVIRVRYAKRKGKFDHRLHPAVRGSILAMRVSSARRVRCVTSNFSRYGGRLDLPRAVENRLLQGLSSSEKSAHSNDPHSTHIVQDAAVRERAHHLILGCLCLRIWTCWLFRAGLSRTRPCFAAHLAQVPKMQWRRFRENRMSTPCSMHR